MTKRNSISISYFLRTSSLSLFVFLTLSFVLTACGDKDKNNTGEDEIMTEVATDNPYQVNFNPFPPLDLAADASPTDLVNFAWEEFIALTWKSSYATNNRRDYPDTTWSWTSDSSPYPDLVVWETYAHRTELRPYDGNMQPFDNPPHYSFGDQLTPATPSTSFTLFNNLDENNEIGSCDLYAHVDKYGKEDMVLYQAKCNRDEYEYILNNYNTNDKLKSATSLTLSNIKSDSTYYKGATSTCNCPPSEGVICLPCGGSTNAATGKPYTGAMEIKTAWRVLVAEDDAAQFFTRNVIYYEKGPNGETLYKNKTFGLIGIHIIHKTTNYPDFIFATWEHVGVQDDDMGYTEIENDGSVGPIVSNFPRINGPIPDLVNESTSAVHDQMAALNPNSIWLNYRLVGVQGHPTNDSTSFSYFLANYVIESDSTLADFRGSGIGKPHDGGVNLLSDKAFFTMGGCKGCHGVAQITLGTDFSFLLDQAGKPVKEPDLIDTVPSLSLTAGEISKLQLYINETQKQQ
ncbi:hypothetical protein [Lewinella sp. LCG006]|uniref:hypothetical protein n=1 Tax=Lewinella sp. LCG006 TaxID=3231911 RepID=UPI003460389A